MARTKARWSGSTWPGEALPRTASPTRWSDEGSVDRAEAQTPLSQWVTGTWNPRRRYPFPFLLR